MSIGVYSAYSTITVLPATSGTPVLTDFIGTAPLPELSDVTLFAYVKPRFAEATEQITSGDAAGTYKSKFAFQYAPFRFGTGSPTFQFPSVGCNLSLDFTMSTTTQTSGASLSLDAAQVVTDDDGGTFTTDARALDTILANVIASDEQWLAVACVSSLPSGVITSYIIDPADGTVLFSGTDTDVQNGSASPFVGATPPDGSLSIARIGGRAPNYVVTNTDFDYKLAEMCIWHGAKTQAELQAFAQVGFAAVNEPTDLVLDWNFMLNWGATDQTTIPDQSGNGNTGDIIDVSSQTQFFTDNPVPVFIPQLTGNEHDEITVNLFSGNSGTVYGGVYPRAATAPTDAELVAGTGALSTSTVTLDGIVTSDITLTQPDTGTLYTVYFVQDTTGGGAYTEVFELDYQSPTKYSETLIDIDGVSLDSITAIEYSWYDSTDFNNLGSAKITGTVEVTNGSGLLETTLPTTITTAKGSDGTMVLKVDDAGTIRTAAHIVTVKQYAFSIRQSEQRIRLLL